MKSKGGLELEISHPLQNKFRMIPSSVIYCLPKFDDVIYYIMPSKDRVINSTWNADIYRVPHSR